MPVISDEAELKLRETEHIIADPDVRAEDRLALIDELEKIRRQLGRYEGKNALEAFLIEFIRVHERGELKRDDKDDAGTYRPEIERALQVEKKCECAQVTCPIKNGQLPGQLRHHGTGRYRRARDPEDELADYLREHPEATIIHEAQICWDQWSGTIQGQVSRLHQTALRALRNGRFDLEEDTDGKTIEASL